MHYLSTLTLKVNAQGDTLQLQSQSAKYMAGSRANLLIAITSSCHFVKKSMSQFHDMMTSNINDSWKMKKVQISNHDSQWSKKSPRHKPKHHVTTRTSVNLLVKRGTLGTLPCSPDYEELESLGNHPRRELRRSELNAHVKSFGRQRFLTTNTTPGRRWFSQKTLQIWCFWPSALKSRPRMPRALDSNWP